MLIERKKIAKAVLIAAAFAVLTGGNAANADSGAKEKCYGISKAGKNDCAANACAGQAKIDRQGDSFLVVPKGSCERIAGGSLQPLK